jgi:hypothetical protein
MAKDKRYIRWSPSKRANDAYSRVCASIIEASLVGSTINNMTSAIAAAAVALPLQSLADRDGGSYTMKDKHVHLSTEMTETEGEDMDESYNESNTFGICIKSMYLGRYAWCVVKVSFILTCNPAV